LGGSVKTVRVMGRQADAINSVVPDIRLDATKAPAEVQPTIVAINGAFDRLSKAYAAHRNFSVRMAHELKGPLAVLSLRLEKLGEESTAEVLRSDVQRLKRLVEQLTGMIRLETGAMQAATDVFDCAQLVEDVISDIVPAALARRVSLGFDRPEPGCFVKGDRAAIWLAIRNLVENALLHSPPDTEIDVTLAHDGLLTVRDHGQGVNPEHQPKIFQRFWRAPSAPAGGSGLGLAIVEEVALQHGGTASVTNHPEGGAIFSLHLPVSGAGKVQESRSA
jgi:signal transduction histidine kinase